MPWAACNTSYALRDRAFNFNQQKIMTRILSGEDYYVLTETMSRYGGHFCKKLAEAIRAADGNNKQKIIDAFPEIVKDYGPGSVFARASGFAHV